MSYLSSSLISVFPSTKRSITQPSSRQMTEENIASIINKLIDMDGFVITDYKSTNVNDPFEFNIYGYHFVVNEAEDIQTLFPSATSIYASITISQTGNFYELQGQDNNNSYEGVNFSNSEPSGTGVHFLKLFERENTNSSWSVPVASMIKLTNVFAKGVDGGVI